MSAEEVRRMVAGWRAIAAIERAEAREQGPDSAAAIACSFELMDLFGRLHGWPPPANEGRRRDDDLARERWNRVRTYYRSHDKTA